MVGHSARVGALAWNGDMLSSGSRDRMILQRDVRTPSIAPERRLVGHRQEVRSKWYYSMLYCINLFLLLNMNVKMWCNTSLT